MSPSLFPACLSVTGHGRVEGRKPQIPHSNGASKGRINKPGLSLESTADSVAGWGTWSSTAGAAPEVGAEAEAERT